MSASKQRVALIVDDEPVIREFARLVLQRRGFSVFAASGATEAQDLSRIGRERIDVLITDVELGDGDGICIAEQLHADRADLPVLVISGSSEHKDRALANRYAFLSKPFLAVQLWEAVDMLLTGQSPAQYLVSSG